jgi:Flp pilus assembly protein TadG
MARSLVRLSRRIAQALFARRLAVLAAEEHGVAMVIYTLALIPMLGMVALTVDMGVEFARKSQMQAAADAAALAAASALGTENSVTLTEARTRAKAVAAANGYPITDANISITESSEDNDTVTITFSHTDNLFFARVLGFNTASPSVTARARVGAVGGMGGGVVPFGVDQGSMPPGGFVVGQQYCLKLDANGPCGGVALQGNFRALNIDLGDQGAQAYRDDLVNGADTPLRIGDTRDVAQGNMAGPTRQGIGCDAMPGGGSGRLTGNTQTLTDVVHDNGDGTYTVLDWDSPRLALLPVVTYPDSQHARVQSFVGFFLESCSGNGNAASVTGRFVKINWPSSYWTPLTGGNDNGARTVRLVG